MKPLLKILFIFVFTSSCQKDLGYEFTSVGALFKDQAASAFVKAERYEDALQLYIHMLEDEPNKPEIHSNIGVIMGQIQKPEDSLRSLQLALKLAEEQKNSRLIFALNFNLGVYYGAQKKIEEALQHYQAALNVNPTSKETKTNIELLIQAENKGGKGASQNKDQNKDSKGDQKDQNKDQNGDDKKDQQKDQKDGQNDNKKDDKDKEQKKEQSERKSSPKYQPRPYQGDQLSEGDVKKILGELRNQEQKIRANFDKKEKKESGNEKDW